MATTMTIGNKLGLSLDYFQPGYSMTAIIANELREAATEIHVSALVAVGSSSSSSPSSSTPPAGSWCSAWGIVTHAARLRLRLRLARDRASWPLLRGRSSPPSSRWSGCSGTW
jgi:hypothetical protein